MASPRENPPEHAEIPRDAWNRLAGTLLPEWLPARRWFRAKSRAIRAVALESRIRLDTPHPVFVVVARVAFHAGADERYLVPLACVRADDAVALPAGSIAGTVDARGTGRAWIDAARDAGFHAALARLLAGDRARSGDGALHGEPVGPETPPGLEPGTAARLLDAEQSNTAIVYGDRAFVKLYRRLEAGLHPEPEMLRHLRTRTAFRNVPVFLSALQWTAPDGTVATAALAQEFTPGDDAWKQLLGLLHAGKDAGADALAARLGAAVGGLHAALAASTEPGFAPEPLEARDVETAAGAVLRQLDSGLAEAARLPDADAAARAAGLVRARDRIAAHVRAAATEAAAGRALRIRIHGDLHLGQVLLDRADGTPRILDFEGEPGRPLADARRKASPLRDVAGMLRSFHYAAHVADRESPRPDPAGADATAGRLSTAFLETYARAFPDARLGPAPAETPLLRLHVLEKAAYELRYELDNRPDWTIIPLLGLRMLAGNPD